MTPPPAVDPEPRNSGDGRGLRTKTAARCWHTGPPVTGTTTTKGTPVNITNTSAGDVVAWFLLANTVVTSLAVVLALLAWRKVGQYCRQCRNVVQAYGPLVERAVERTQPQEPPLLCGDYRSAAFQGGTGKHAATGLMPAVGELPTPRGDRS